MATKRDYLRSIFATVYLRRYFDDEIVQNEKQTLPKISFIYCEIQEHNIFLPSVKDRVRYHLQILLLISSEFKGINSLIFD